MENANAKIIKSSLLAALIFFYMLFGSAFFVFLGFLFGNVNAENRYEDGLSFGYHRGKYEIYLELEEKGIGTYNSEEDTFDYFERAESITEGE